MRVCDVCNKPSDCELKIEFADTSCKFDLCSKHRVKLKDMILRTGRPIDFLRVFLNSFPDFVLVAETGEVKLLVKDKEVLD